MRSFLHTYDQISTAILETLIKSGIVTKNQLNNPEIIRAILEVRNTHPDGKTISSQVQATEGEIYQHINELFE